MGREEPSENSFEEYTLKGLKDHLAGEGASDDGSSFDHVIPSCTGKETLVDLQTRLRSFLKRYNAFKEKNKEQHSKQLAIVEKDAFGMEKVNNFTFRLKLLDSLEDYFKSSNPLIVDCTDNSRFSFSVPSGAGKKLLVDAIELIRFTLDTPEDSSKCKEMRKKEFQTSLRNQIVRMVKPMLGFSSWFRVGKWRRRSQLRYDLACDILRSQPEVSVNLVSHKVSGFKLPEKNVKDVTDSRLIFSSMQALWQNIRAKVFKILSFSFETKKPTQVLIRRFDDPDPDCFFLDGNSKAASEKSGQLLSAFDHHPKERASAIEMQKIDSPETGRVEGLSEKPQQPQNLNPYRLFSSKERRGADLSSSAAVETKDVIGEETAEEAKIISWKDVPPQKSSAPGFRYGSEGDGD